MSPQGVIAAIASNLRSGTKHIESAIAEGTSLYKQSADGTNYGSSSWPDDPIEAARRVRREAEEAASSSGGQVQTHGAVGSGDNVDEEASVWRGVETHGLDGNGSVDDGASVKGDREEPSLRAKQALIRTPYHTLALEQILLLPLLVLLFTALLLTLAHYAWPPIGNHTGGGQDLPHEPYPHPFAWRPFVLGALAGVAARSLRRGVGVAVEECLGVGSSGGERSGRKGVRLAAALISTVLHTMILESIRLLVLPLMSPTLHVATPPGLASDSFATSLPSTSALLQAAFHAGIGFGVSEAGWGIAHGWAQGLLPYKSVLGIGMELERGESEIHRIRSLSSASSAVEEDRRDSGAVYEGLSPDDMDIETGAEADLAKTIEALENMRARAELEAALGVPYPNINFALHILWRLDTILINLGFTLITAAFYYNPDPLYRKHGGRPSEDDEMPTESHSQQSTWLPLVLTGIIVLHSLVNLAWSLSVKRLGLGAMTWGSLILSLMALFAGLGCWGALV